MLHNIGVTKVSVTLETLAFGKTYVALFHATVVNIGQ